MLVDDNGLQIQSIDLPLSPNGCKLWTWAALDGTPFLALALSSLGTERGGVLLWDAGAGAALSSFTVAVPRPLCASVPLGNNGDVLCWSGDGSRITALSSFTVAVPPVFRHWVRRCPFATLGRRHGGVGW